MRALAEDGLAILFANSHLEEVMGISDRIAVMADGRVTATFDGETAPAAEIVAAAQKQQKVPA